MADFWTHYYVGKQILENYNRLNNKSFILGCQNSDLFFYYKFKIKTKPPNLGQLIHNNQIKKTFEKLFEYLIENKNLLITKSYIYGFITHYILDKNIHPYINSKSDFNHKRLEADIDTYIVDKFLNKSIFQMNSKDILYFDKNYNQIHEFYKFINEEIFNTKYNKKVFKKSISNFRFFHKVFNNKTNFKRKIIIYFFKLFKLDLKSYFYRRKKYIELPEDILKIDKIIEDSIIEIKFYLEKVDMYLDNKISKKILLKSIDKDYNGNML
ncbi:MAG: zinc dependent phospholipase C family protein [Bacillota bacterium]